MKKLSDHHKCEIKARLAVFPYSGFSTTMTANLKYVGSFVGRDFKTFAQLAPFIIFPYLDQLSMQTWLLLTKV